MPIPGGGPFATFMIIGPVCFFLGILFASFPYDYYVLWSTPPSNSTPTFPVPLLDPSLLSDPPTLTQLRDPYFSLLEHHLRTLHASPPLISRVLHIAISVGIFGLLAKLYKPTEANYLFDGASLVLYMCGITVYISNLIKGMRVITAGNYGVAGSDFAASRFPEDNMQIAEDVASGAVAAGTVTVGREDTLRVMAASNTILALVLVGVLILQAGQWYAQKREGAEIEEMDRVAKAKRAEAGGAGGAGAGATKAGTHGHGHGHGVAGAAGSAESATGSGAAVGGGQSARKRA